MRETNDWLDARFREWVEVHRSESSRVVSGELRSGEERIVKLFELPEAGDPVGTRRYEIERDLTRAVEHGCVARVVDAGSAHPRCHFLEYRAHSGTTLQQHLDTEGRLEVDRATRILLDILEGLAEIHRVGIVHRDVKPANIFVPSDPQITPYLMDFGIAVRGADANHVDLSPGTIGYAPPEQLRGEKPLPSADVYAWAMALVACVLGPDFSAQHGFAESVRNRSIGLPQEIEGGLRRAIEAALAPAAAQRPEDAKALRTLLASPRSDGPEHGESRPTSPQLPFVGRQTDIDALSVHIRSSLDGQAAIASIVAGPGMGKTRIVAELSDRFRARTEAVIARNDPEHSGTPFWALRSSLRRVLSDRGVFGRASGDSSTDSLLGDLLELDWPSDPSLQDLSPQRRRDLGLRAAASALLQSTREQPLLLIVEDLHWADPTTLEWLSHVVDGIRSRAAYPEEGPTHLCVFLTARPEFRSPWSKEQVPHHDLGKLNPQDSVALLRASMSGPGQLDDGVIRGIVEQADGVPMYLAEITRVASASRNDGSILPETLSAVVDDRIAALPAELQEISQVAAAIGLEFPLTLLERVSARPPERLRPSVRALIEAGVFERSGRDWGTLAFSHMFLRDATYSSMESGSKRLVHGQIAAELEHEYRQSPRSIGAEVLAYHHERAGANGPAVGFRRVAGQRAVAESALDEARSHFEQGLRLILADESLDDRDQQELWLQTDLATAMIAKQGYASPTVSGALARARELAQSSGHRHEETFQVLRALWSHYHSLADLRSAMQLAEDLYSRAEERGDVAWQLASLQALCQTAYCMGDFAAAAGWAIDGMRRYDPVEHGELTLAYGDDPYLGLATFGALSLHSLGQFARAMDLGNRALAMAKRLRHPHLLAGTLDQLAFLALLRDDRAQMSSYATQAVDIAREHGFPFWEAYGLILVGAARLDADPAGGTADIELGTGMWRMAGARLGSGWHCFLRARARLASGDLSAAAEEVDLGIEHVEATGEVFFEPHLWALSGEIHRRMQDIDGARSLLQRAIRRSDELKAAGLALPAAIELVKLEADRAGRATAIRGLESVVARLDGEDGMPLLTQANELLRLAHE